MYIQSNNPKTIKANCVVQKKSNTKKAFGFVDNRPQSIELVQLRKVFNESVQCVKNKEAKKAPSEDVKKKIKKADFHKRVIKGLPTGKMKYIIGQHGAKSCEQKRLKNIKGIAVSGSTHESEHTIGYAVLSGGFLPRGESTDAQVLENIAPAYQEVKALHRDHIGTGSSSTPDETNMNADQYRNMQRGLLTGETGYHKELANRPFNSIGVSLTEGKNAVSNAVQINQLGYGQQLRNKKYSHISSTALGQANDSYKRMVDNMQSIDYVKDAHNADKATVLEHSKLEMILARYAAITGKWPKEQASELNELLGASTVDTKKVNQVINSLNFY
ncbi:hypothetical protein [Pectobacterium polaris]|uniref:hypothetical protein n=1 Tax=Pectobacterium polaris TaxID=2042057 RepID=UPI000BB378A8|nr:hypothetical protein [Pectobacterium polaris]ASY77296.1 hypothetical protein BJJ97_15890 [Pectobacterium polaris]